MDKGLAGLLPLSIDANTPVRKATPKQTSISATANLHPSMPIAKITAVTVVAGVDIKKARVAALEAP